MATQATVDQRRKIADLARSYHKRLKGKAPESLGDFVEIVRKADASAGAASIQQTLDALQVLEPEAWFTPDAGLRIYSDPAYAKAKLEIRVDKPDEAEKRKAALKSTAGKKTTRTRKTATAKTA